MKNSKRRKWLIACAAVGVFILFNWLLTLPLSPSGLQLEAGWKAVDASGAQKDVSLPYLQPLEKGQEVTLQTRFPYIAGDTLVIRRPSGNAVQVFLNGEQIYVLGNWAQPTANIWNSILAIPLLHDLREENLLEIRMRGGSYDLGLTLPPYIESYAKVINKINLAELLYQNLLLISIGAVIIVGLVLIVLSFAQNNRFQAEFFLGMAALFSAVFGLDYVFRLSSGSAAGFFWVKKLIMISGYLAALCFVAGLEKYAHGGGKISRIMIVPTLASVAVIAAAWEISVFNLWLPYLNIILLLNLAATILITLKNLSDKEGLIVPAVLLILSLLQLVILTLVGLSLPFVLPYVLLVSALTFGVTVILEYNQLYRENLDLERRVNRDPLTGAYNRNIFPRINPRLHDILILIDVDNLKHYNDRFGHPKGDRLLVCLTETISTNLRQNDLVIRYGGDEFVIILNSASEEDADRIVQRIRRQLTYAFTDEQASFSYGIVRIENSLLESFEKADKRMYAMKNIKKIPLSGDQDRSSATPVSRTPV